MGGFVRLFVVYSLTYCPLGFRDWGGPTERTNDRSVDSELRKLDLRSKGDCVNEERTERGSPSGIVDSTFGSPRE